MKSGWILLAAWIVSVGSAVEASESKVSASDSAEALVRAFAQEKGLPGMAAAVGKNKTILWSVGVGVANVEDQTPVSSERSKFRIGSTSKALTSLGLAKLIDLGKLKVDAPIQDYVADFPAKPEGEITLRQLAGHLAGIRHYRDTSELGNVKAYRTITEAVVYFRDDPLVAIPGERFSYSTYGYTLLSAAIEGASGQLYLRYMEEAVFQPLGMHNTTADIPQRVIQNRTGFYYREKEGLLNGPYIDTSNKWAGGGYLSSANDLVRFGLAFFDTKVIRPATRTLLWTPQLTLAGERTSYGLGWFIGKDSAGRRWVQHPGGTVGGSVLLRIYPDDGVVISLLGNLSMVGDDRFGDIPDQLFALFQNK